MSPRDRRVSASVLAIVFTLLSFVALTRAFRTAERPVDEPTPKPPGIFSEVGGWIVYGDNPYDPLKEGIWAVDPTRPGDPKDQIQLSTERGMPLAWSRDGSKLLIQGYASDPQTPGRLFVLNADGTETYLTTIEGPILPGGFFRGGSFSPDGSQVIYAERGSIYVVDTQGGTPRILLTAGRRWSPGCGCSFHHPWVFNPTYSPDETQIAYSDGIGDNSHQLRVMNADGSGTHVLVDEQQGHTMNNFAWSPDGERLAFGLGRSSGIYIVGADGSGLTLVIPDATYPYWSPDGSRISYQPPGAFSPLEIADADGMRVVKFGYGGSGPWNPLVQPEHVVAEALAASEGLTLTSTPLLVVALLALVAGVVLIRRRMGGNAGSEIAPKRP
jgi:Tol biopolymer transport system component